MRNARTTRGFFEEFRGSERPRRLKADGDHLLAFAGILYEIKTKEPLAVPFVGSSDPGTAFAAIREHELSKTGQTPRSSGGN